MLKHYLLALCIVACVFAGCSDHIYAPALYKADVAYQFKPMSSDSVKSANYISGSAYFGTGSEALDNIFLANLNYSRATTYKHIDLAYGGFGYLGHYKNYAVDINDPAYFSVKSIAGFGLRASADYFYTEGRTDLRFGLDGFYSKEFGGYADYRRSALGPSNFYSDPSTTLFTMGIAAEDMTHWVRDPQVEDGYRFFAGSALGNHSFKNAAGEEVQYNNLFFNKDFFLSFAYALKYHKTLFVFEVQDFSSFSFTLGYKL